MATSLKVIAFGILAVSLQSHLLIESVCISCLRPWKSFGNHCYLVVTDPKTFDEAEQYCQSLSRHGRPSHLMSIMSQEEHDFLIQLITSAYGNSESIWIGYRLVSDGSFAWIDGSSSGTFTNWAPGEPNNLHGVEECGEIITPSNLWNDDTCSDEKGFVCKIPERFSAEL